MVEKLLYSLGPVIAVLIGEHIILRLVYRKKSSIERLFIGVSNSAKSDWVMAGFWYIAFKFKAMRPFISFITLPGLAFLGLKWLQPYLQWSGLFGQHLLENPVAQIILWFILYDFTHYLAHVLMHRSSALWRFHRLHHAATEFTILNGIRTSLPEHFFNKLVSFFLLGSLLGIPKPEILYVVMFIRRVVDLIQHSDLPWDYGIAGYVIASPRYHRLHHSNQPEDYDSNYGNIFSFWDYLFGTTSIRYCNSRSIADTCHLGLKTKEESIKLNRWETALINETIFHYAWEALRRFLNIKLA